MKKLLPLAIVAALSAGSILSAQAAEVSGAVGVTGQGDMTYRLGMGFDWNKSWWETSTGRLTGYWDAGYTYWEGADHYSSAKHSLSFAPVFVYEFGNGSVKPFIEAGIGVSVFSSTRVGEKDLGSAFNFEDRIGAGVKIGETQRVGIRATHYSNAGIKDPNDGIESYALFYSHTI
ncbi:MULTISPECIES: acyloxyacyl hydrolase [Pseudomonas]|uniref:Lipid A deacylase n=2 Tax=Pseudomonas TaxID=286 RepID=A0ABS0MU55_PSELU|nr:MULTISPECIES: acyloxyacyl hydrolase [Pseudomonas]MBH3440279.1 acyloxyacyl hydrolase [Pseudomonas luteola]SEP84969.1 lipid A 3-O-deacylase [Pseudomonas lutea]